MLGHLALTFFKSKAGLNVVGLNANSVMAHDAIFSVVLVFLVAHQKFSPVTESRTPTVSPAVCSGPRTAPREPTFPSPSFAPPPCCLLRIDAGVPYWYSNCLPVDSIGGGLRGQFRCSLG